MNGGCSFPLGMLISGIEKSMFGLKPSDVLALHSPLMKSLKNFGLLSGTSGA